MIYAYIKMSADRQTAENQRSEILKKVTAEHNHIDQWIEETVSSYKIAGNRKLGPLLETMQDGDRLYVTELSRLGRSILEVMSILQVCMEKNVRVHAIKEGYVLGTNFNPKVLAFTFRLSVEIERQIISQRTKEALKTRKADGVHLGRPKGSLSKQTKLTGKEEKIRELLEKRVSVSAIGRVMGVNRQTVSDFISSRNIA